MKNRISLLGIIAIVAIIGFGFTACGGDDDNTGGNNTGTQFIEMVSISEGTFQMGTESGGDNKERPVRQVTLSAFKMGKYQVTQEQYHTVMGTNPSHFSSNPATGEIQGRRP